MYVCMYLFCHHKKIVKITNKKNGNKAFLKNKGGHDFCMIFEEKYNVILLYSIKLLNFIVRLHLLREILGYMSIINVC